MELDRLCPSLHLFFPLTVAASFLATSSTIIDDGEADDLNRPVKADFIGDLLGMGAGTESKMASISLFRALSNSSPAKHAAATAEAGA